MENLPVLRVFISLNPPPGIVGKLLEIQAHLRATLEKRFPAGPWRIRWTRPDQLHLTVLFLGNVFQHQVDDLRCQVEQVVESVPRLPALKLQGFGCFPAFRHPRVIWFGAAPNSDFDLLQSALFDCFSRQLSLDNRDRSYPHLTLARSGSKSLPAELSAVLAGLTRAENAPSLPWEVRSVALMQSVQGPQGSEYTCLAQFGGA
jgi:2'-5' RNA ligase